MKKMKTKIIATSSLILVIIIMFLLVSGDESGEGNEPSVTIENHSENNFEEIATLTILSDGEISRQECIERDLHGKVVMLESQYCGHCKKTLPIFEAACEELGLTPLVVDISTKEGVDLLTSYGIEIQYTPTFIFDCKYYVGAKQSKEEYVQLLGDING